MKKKLPLILILLLAAVLRIYRLGELPIALFGDEVDVGYHAWSLWTTGRDYMGHFLPTYIYSLAETRAPLLMYVTAPFVGLLGPSAFSVRLPVALLGILNVYLLYLLTNKLFTSRTDPEVGSVLNAGLLASFLLAISPWHLHYSRAAFEVTLLLSLILAGVYLFLRWIDSPQRFPIWPLPFALTFYTYSTANLFTPLLVLALLIIYRPKFQYVIHATYYLLLLVPIGYQLLLGPAAGRFNLVSIFNDQKLLDDIIVTRTEPWVVPGIDETIFHNKPLAFVSTFGRQYIQAFSLDFLFLDGDPILRHSVGRFGELPWFLLPFLLIGIAISIISLIRNSKLEIRNSAIILLSWLFLAPIPSALTQGGGTHATRLFIMLPPLIILSTLGFQLVLSKIKNSKLSTIYYLTSIILATFYVASYWHHYADHYRFQSAKYWHYGYEQVFNQLKSLNPTGRVFINNTYEPALLRFAFYTQLPPDNFQDMFTTDVPQDGILPDFNGFKFGDRYYFGQVPNQGALQALLAPGDLYLAVQLKEIPGDWDWSVEPPRDLQVFAQTRNLYGDPLFSWVGTEAPKQ